MHKLMFAWQPKPNGPIHVVSCKNGQVKYGCHASEKPNIKVDEPQTPLRRSIPNAPESVSPK